MMSMSTMSREDDEASDTPYHLMAGINVEPKNKIPPGKVKNPHPSVGIGFFRNLPQAPRTNDRKLQPSPILNKIMSYLGTKPNDAENKDVKNDAIRKYSYGEIKHYNKEYYKLKGVSRSFGGYLDASSYCEQYTDLVCSPFADSLLFFQNLSHRCHLPDIARFFVDCCCISPCAMIFVLATSPCACVAACVGGTVGGIKDLRNACVIPSISNMTDIIFLKKPSEVNGLIQKEDPPPDRPDYIPISQM